MPALDHAVQLGREIASLRREVRSLSRASGAANRSMEIGGESTSLPALLGIGQAAQDTATVALATANGKNTVTYSVDPADPADPGTTAGDIWFQRDVATGVITAAWEWDGTDWQPRTFGDGVFDHITAGKIATGELAAGTRVSAGPLSGAHAEMHSSGFSTFAVDPGTGLPYEATRMGQGADTLAAAGPDGSVTFAVDEDGIGSFRGLSVSSDPSLNGRPLSAWLADGPRGLVASSWNPSLTVNNIRTRYGLGEVSFLSHVGRNYKITWQPPHLYASTAATRALLTLRVTLDGSAPTINSDITDSLFFTIDPGGNLAVTPPPLVAYGTFTNVEGALIRVIATVESFDASGGLIGVTTFSTTDPYWKPFRLWVEDIGPDVPDTYISNPGGGTLSGGAPPPPPPAAKTTQTVQWGAEWSNSYRGSGALRTDTGDLYQGYGDSFNGRNSAFVGFDSASIMSYLSGAEINNVEIYLYAEHWWDASGGTAVVGVHGNASAPGTLPAYNLGNLGTYHFGRGEGAWISIPSALWAGWQTGAYKGLTFGAPDNSAVYYGRFSGAGKATEPIIRITFTK